MAWPIPWDNIDREMVKLIRLLNDTHIVRTIGCCAGHHIDESAHVAFLIMEDGLWETKLLPVLCDVSAQLNDANVVIYKEYFANKPGNVIAQWGLLMEPHPGSVDIQETRLKVDKAIKAVEQRLEKYIEEMDIGTIVYKWV